MQLEYIVTPEIQALGIVSTVVAEIHGVRIQREDPQLTEMKKETLSRVLGLSEISILENAVLQSYRELVRKVGRSSKKFPPAAESLIHLMRGTGRFPLINTAVDAYNLVVTKRLLALGVHDLDKLTGPITFRVSQGEEPFMSVGTDKLKHTQKGDYVYSDAAQVLAWLDSKDSDHVKLSLETTNIVLVIQGTDFTTREYNLDTATEACSLITHICGGSYEIKAL